MIRSISGIAGYLNIYTFGRIEAHAEGLLATRGGKTKHELPIINNV